MQRLHSYEKALEKPMHGNEPSSCYHLSQRAKGMQNPN